MEHQQLLALHHGKYKDRVATFNYDRPIGRLSKQTLL